MKEIFLISKTGLKLRYVSYGSDQNLFEHNNLCFDEVFSGFLTLRAYFPSQENNLSVFKLLQCKDTSSLHAFRASIFSSFC